MNVFERAVVAYLEANGSTPQPTLYTAVVVRTMISVDTFRKRLERMAADGHIQNTALPLKRGVWAVKPKRSNTAPNAKPLVKRHHSVMDAPAAGRNRDAASAPRRCESHAVRQQAGRFAGAAPAADPYVLTTQRRHAVITAVRLFRLYVRGGVSLVTAAKKAIRAAYRGF